MTWMTVLSLIIRLLFGERQRELEHRAAAVVGMRRDAAAMCFDDSAADRQSHPHPVRLAGHKRLKQLLRDFRHDAGAGVCHKEKRKFVVPRDANRQLSSTSGFHRLDGIPDQVECDLLDLYLVDHDIWKITLTSERYP